MTLVYPIIEESESGEVHTPNPIIKLLLSSKSQLSSLRTLAN